ncbi:hypothetical protein ABPG72_002630 [Tetrahymena utriculariae]
MSAGQKQSKESIINLSQYIGKDIRVKFQGGREVTGVLKSFDNQLNMILDDCIETIRDKSDPYLMTDQKRKLNLVVVRGTLVSTIFPMSGTEIIENPFLSMEEQ